MSALSLFEEDVAPIRPEARTARRLIAGIDPDLKGAIVVLSDTDGPPLKFPMPTYKVPKKQKGKKGNTLYWIVYDEVQIRSILSGNDPDTGISFNQGEPIPHVFIEKPLVSRESEPLRCDNCQHIVLMRTPEPSFSMSRKFEAFGLIRGICCGLGVLPQLLHPRTWQARMLDGAPSNLTTKGRAQYNAKRLFPSFDLREHDRCRVPYQGVCDALLIAEFGRRNLGLDLCVEDEELGF